MRVLVASDIHIGKFGNKFFAKSQVSTILERYYQNFGAMTLCCRVKKIDENTPDYHDISDWVDEIIPVTSLGKMLVGGYKKQLMEAIQNSDMVVCRCPAFSAYRAADYARKIKKHYFAESMGCAWDAYWNHSIIGKLVAPYMFFKMRQTVKNADYALYVTSEFLQNRYPCEKEGISASNVRISSIDPEVLERRLARIRSGTANTVTLMTTAAVDVLYKGQEYVIRAIPMLNQAGLRVKYVLIGGGDQTYLRNVAEKCGVADQVEFAGRMPLDEVFARLDEADIYIQPSLQEGLPRSVIEAMSRACPAIGAKTAGIPELIAPECVVRRKSAQDIADTVLAIWNEEKLTALAKQNFENAGEYLDEVLTQRREAYFARIKKELQPDSF